MSKIILTKIEDIKNFLRDIRGCFESSGYRERIIYGGDIEFAAGQTRFDLIIESPKEDEDYAALWRDKEYSEVEKIEISEDDSMNKGELLVEMHLKSKYDNYQSFWLRVVDDKEKESYSIETNEEIFERYKALASA